MATVQEAVDKKKVGMIGDRDAGDLVYLSLIHI